MQILLFLVFIGVPIAEIALFIEAAKLIGVVPTILLTIATAFAGTALMRMQGFATLSRVTESLQKGEMPVAPVLDGMGIFVAGILLLTPGLLTDAIGLLLFIPPVRRRLGRWIFSKLAKSGVYRFSTYGGPPPRQPGPSKPANDGFKRSDDVVDAEFETIDPDDPDLNASEAKPLNRKGADGKSPWRRR